MISAQQLYDATRELVGTAGTCEPEVFLEHLNAAGPMVLKRVDAEGMIWTWRSTICGSCVTLSGEIRGIRQAWLCGESMDIKSEWWHGRLTGGLYHDTWKEYPWRNLVDSGRRIPTQRIVNATNVEVFEIKSYSREDAGKVVMVKYAPCKGTLKTWKATLREDVRPVLSKPDIGEVLYVEKPRTVGKVELWARNLDTGHRRLLAVYDPLVEIPEFPIYEITGTASGTLDVKAKRVWTPVRSMDDIIWWGDAEAWGAALVAENYWREGDNDSKEAALGHAVGILALDLKDKQGAAQTKAFQMMTPWSIQSKFRNDTRYF